MASAKDIRVVPIRASDADRVVKSIHYSGKVAPNSQLHFGVFLGDKCLGAMQFGPPMDRRKLLPLVQGTGWNGMMELNRMAFSDALPRNSESRALGVAFRLMRKAYPHLQWVVSFADATQCGDGTIYRAAGFVLTGIKRNSQILELESGVRVSKMTITKGRHILTQGGRAGIPDTATLLPGFQLRYIYFLNPAARDRLTVPVLPFDAIQKAGAGMYRGEKRVGSADSGTGGVQPSGGGASPTSTLHLP